MKGKIIGFIILIIVIAACGIGAWLWSLANTKYEGQELRINLPAKSSEKAVADSLQHHLGDFGERVAKLWKMQRGKSASGSYVVKSGTSALQLSRNIRNGLQQPVRVTFNNARTMRDLAEAVCKNLEATPNQFLQACDSILPEMGFKKEEYQAAFLPDTYEFYWNASPDKIVKRLVDYREKFWTDKRKKQAAALGLSPTQAAILASIVEEETNKADEKPIVARLYMNRLKKDMLLQADPTVKYAVGDFGLKRILQKHLNVESPYNTYKHHGLPPGPIRIPSGSTIDALLNAPANNYIYMCAKEDFSGYHNFTSNYSEHLNNARRYQAALNKRNIK